MRWRSISDDDHRIFIHMKYLNLKAYSDFVCVGDKCPYTCCGGWKIVIDEATATYYRNVTGEMGERLQRNTVTENGVTRFVLTDSGRCPFLNERGLCDIYINLGEEHLSQTCTYFPRYAFLSGDIRFSGVSISCPVVSEFFLTHNDTIEIDFREDETKLNTERVDWNTFDQAVRVFGATVDIAQNRNLLIKERIALVTILIYQFQAYIDSGREPDGMIELFSDPEKYVGLLSQTGIYDRDFESKIGFCSEIMNYFRCVDNISAIVPELDDLVSFFEEPEHSRVGMFDWDVVFSEFDGAESQIWLEQILVYVIYRYLLRDIEKKDFLRKYLGGLEFVLEMGLCIMALSHIKNGAETTLEEKTMITAHVSRLIEHSPSFVEQSLNHFEEKGMTDLQFVLKLIS